MSWFLGLPFNSEEHRPFQAPCWLELWHGLRFGKYFRLFISSSHEACAASACAAGTSCADLDGSLSYGTARVPMDAIRGRLVCGVRIQLCFLISRPRCERRTSGGQVRRCGWSSICCMMCQSNAMLPRASLRRPSRDLPTLLGFHFAKLHRKREEKLTLDWQGNPSWSPAWSGNHLGSLPGPHPGGPGGVPFPFCYFCFCAMASGQGSVGVPSQCAFAWP